VAAFACPFTCLDRGARAARGGPRVHAAGRAASCSSTVRPGSGQFHSLAATMIDEIKASREHIMKIDLPDRVPAQPQEVPRQTSARARLDAKSWATRLKAAACARTDVDTGRRDARPRDDPTALTDPRPGHLVFASCTRRTRRRRSTASWTCSLLTSRARCGAAVGRAAGISDPAVLPNADGSRRGRRDSRSSSPTPR